STLPEKGPLWVDALSSVLLTFAMGVLLMSSLNADPLTLLSSRKRVALKRDWLRISAVVPLIIGTFAAYLGATVFVDFFDIAIVRSIDPETAAAIAALPLHERLGVEAQLCSAAVNPNYFGLVVQVLPVLLLAIGVDFNFAKHALRDPAQRASAVAALIV